MKNIDNWDAMMKDVDLLHSCRSSEEFFTVAQLVIKLWTEAYDENIFSTYFKETYLDDGTWNQWYIGAAPPGVPLTNNPMESFNKRIKAILDRNKSTLSEWLSPGGRGDVLFGNIDLEWTIKKRINLPYLSQTDMLNLVHPTYDMASRALEIAKFSESYKSFKTSEGKITEFVVSTGEVITDEKIEFFHNLVQGEDIENLTIEKVREVSHYHRVEVRDNHWEDPLDIPIEYYLNRRLAKGDWVLEHGFVDPGYVIIKTFNSETGKVTAYYIDEHEEEMTKEQAMHRLLATSGKICVCDCGSYHKNSFMCKHCLAILYLLYGYDLVQILSCVGGIKPLGRPSKRRRCMSQQILYLPRSSIEHANLSNYENNQAAIPFSEIFNEEDFEMG